jgi:iron complex outermembrane receptor protein
MILRKIIALTLASVSLSAMAEEVSPTVIELDSELRYQSESVQWTPHSVTVLSKDNLENSYRRDLEGIESMVPGLIVDRMNTTPRGAAIAIRGLGSSGASKGFDPAVAVNIDGVYVGTHTGRLQVLFDFEKIEVVRSPHTFESNPNLSGSINIQRTRPTGELDVDLRAVVGIDERREIDVIINLPEVAGVKAKLAVYRKDRGGDYFHNDFNLRNENTEDYSVISTTFGWDFRELFTTLYTFDSESSDETTPALLNISAPTDLLCVTTASGPFPNCRRGVGNPELDSLRKTSQNFSNERSYDADHHTLKVEFDAFNHHVISITGNRESDEDMDLDLDASQANFYHLQQSQSYSQFSQEITALGEWNERLSYSFGFYYLDSDYDIFQQEYHILKKLGDAGFSEGHAAGEVQELSSAQKTELQSYFAHVNYVINDQWIADLGFRWTELDRKFEHSPSRIRLGNSLSPLRTLLLGKESSKEGLLSGGLSYKVDDAAMIYARYSEGFLPGGFDENAMSVAAGNSYGSETSRTAEIGLKSDWWGDRLRVNVAYYKTEVDNTVERFDAIVTDGQIESLLDNVAEVEISGWELELTAIPLDNLTIRTSYSHISANYEKYIVPDLITPGELLSRSELTPERAPGDNLFLSAEYAIPYGPGIIRTYAGYRLFSDYQTFPLLAEGKVNNWTSWDLSVSYEWKEWMFRLFSNNVKSKEFIQNINSISQTAVLPVPAGNSSVPSLMTITEYNQPRFTGLEIIYRPDF